MHSAAAWAGTFARGQRNALMRRYVTMVRHMSPSKVPSFFDVSGPHGSLDPHESAPQMASRSVQPFLHSLPVCPKHRQTDHAIRMTYVAIGRIYTLRTGDAA